MARQHLGSRGRIGALLGTPLVMLALAGCGGLLGGVNGRDRGVVSPAPSPPTQLRAVLRGSQEVARVVTPASGTATVTVSGDRSQITTVLTTQGLVNPTAAHIHVGPVAVDGPIIFTLFSAATDGALPATVTRILTAANLEPKPAQGINTFADAVNAILTGGTYINAHTTANPGGEIRGQVGPVTLQATLVGSEQVPPVTTTASGTATVRLNETQTQATVTLNTAGLVSPILAHIHAGAAGVNGPVILPLYAAATDGPLPATLTRTVTAADLQPQPAAGVTTFDDAVNAMLSGNAYPNVHTTANPGGEIRGQLTP